MEDCLKPKEAGAGRKGPVGDREAGRIMMKEYDIVQERSRMGREHLGNGERMVCHEAVMR